MPDSYVSRMEVRSQTHADVDDLLGCDCTRTKASERSSILDSPAKASITALRDSSSDEEERQSRFVPASQYDSAPVSRRPMLTRSKSEEPFPDLENAEEGISHMLSLEKEIRLISTNLQAAEENTQKLASLKQWHHVDGFDKQSFEGLKDDVLYDMLWTDWKSLSLMEDVESTPSPASVPANMFRSSTEASRHSKKLRVTETEEDMDTSPAQLFVWDSDVEPNISKGTIKVPSTSGSGSDARPSEKDDSDSDPERVVLSVPSKRKAKRTAPTTKSSSRLAWVSPNLAKRHNLKEIAENGQGGRVMFVLEKVTESKMTD